MNPDDKKKFGIIVLAVAAGLIAAILTGNYVRNESAARAKEYEQKKLVPLMKEIDSLKDQAQKQNQMIRSLQEAPSRMAARGPAGPGEPAVQISLAAQTPMGKRAITVLIDSLSAVGGLVNPGDYVDVLARMAVPRSTSPTSTQSKIFDSITAIVFQNVQVLAVGTNVGRPGSYEAQQAAKALPVTLALAPQEAGLMSFILQNGQIQFALRPPADTTTETELSASDWGNLAAYMQEKHGIELNAPKPPPVISTTETQEIEPVIQIFRGGQEL